MKLLPEQQNLINNTFQQGHKALQLGLFNQAEHHFFTILKINPNILEARAALAYVYASSKQHANAIQQLKLMLKANPSHAQTHFNLGNSLYEMELFEEALKHYQLTVLLEPNFVDANIHCGIANHMLKNYEAAIAFLHQALNLDKANARAFHVLGMVYSDIDDYNRALHYLESATGLAPLNADYKVSFASVLEKAFLDLEAGVEYHKACEANPNHLSAFSLYGNYLLKNHRYDEALECAMRAEQIAPKNLDVTDQLAQIYLGMSNTDAALKKFNTALQIEPQRLSALQGKARVYQELGNAEEGFEVCDTIIAVDNNLPSGYLLKSRMKKSKLGDGLTENLLRTLNQQDLDEETLKFTYFGLGKIYDDQNNYFEAFKHYTLANNIKNKSLHFSAKDDETRFSRLIDVFDADFFKTHQHLGVDSKLPVIIVGMPRSGTTLTEQIISSHPNVIGAGEVVFWSRTPTAMPLRLATDISYPDCVKELNIEQAKDIAGMYEATLRKIAGTATNPTHITDKMPHNFLYAGLIALLFPNAKIIHTMRNPLDTCLSIYFQNFNNGHDYASDLTNLGFHYKQYQRIMQHWHSVLPGRILEIKYEDTIANPEFWSRKLIDHIGLEWNDACLAPHKLERSVKTASHWQVRQPIYKTSVQRWKHYEEFLSPLIEALKD